MSGTEDNLQNTTKEIRRKGVVISLASMVVVMIYMALVMALVTVMEMKFPEVYYKHNYTLYLKQHAHAEKVTVTAAYLIHILQATVTYLKKFTISQIIHYSVQCRTQKQHLSMLSSVRLCCLSEIALILVLFSEFS